MRNGKITVVVLLSLAIATESARASAEAVNRQAEAQQVVTGYVLLSASFWGAMSARNYLIEVGAGMRDWDAPEFACHVALGAAEGAVMALASFWNPALLGVTVGAVSNAETVATMTGLVADRICPPLIAALGDIANPDGATASIVRSAIADIAGTLSATLQPIAEGTDTPQVARPGYAVGHLRVAPVSVLSGLDSLITVEVEVEVHEVIESGGRVFFDVSIPDLRYAADVQNIRSSGFDRVEVFNAGEKISAVDGTETFAQHVLVSASSADLASEAKSLTFSVVAPPKSGNMEFKYRTTLRSADGMDVRVPSLDVADGYDQQHAPIFVSSTELRAFIPSPSTRAPSAQPDRISSRWGSFPLTVEFTAPAINDPDTFYWEFGDGGTSTERQPTYTYQTEGRYTVTLTVCNEHGCDRAVRPDYISPPGSPVAIIGSDIREGCAPLAVRFYDASSGVPYERSWVFEGGQPGESTSSDEIVRYTQPGAYRVILETRNGRGSDRANRMDFIRVTGFCDDIVLPPPVAPDPEPESPGGTLAGEIRPGDEISGLISRTGVEGRQSYVLHVQDRQSVRIDLAAGFDAYWRLYEIGSDRHFISRRDERSARGRARAVADPVLEAGPYRVEVAAIGDDETGSFTLRIGPAVRRGLSFVDIGAVHADRIVSTGAGGRSSFLMHVGTSRRVRFVVNADFQHHTTVYSTAHGFQIISAIAAEGQTGLDWHYFFQPGIYRVEVASVGDAQTGSLSVRLLDGTGLRPGAKRLAAAAVSVYPNPFNSEVRLDVHLATEGEITAEVYDLLGRRVRTLLQDYARPGQMRLTWDGRSDEGRLVGSGSYFVRVRGRDATVVEQVTLLR